MRAPRLLVIQHDLDDHLNELAGPLTDAGLLIEPWFAHARPEPPSDASDYDGIVSLGATVGVNDEGDHAWMSTERKLLEEALADGTPTLGVCFGAQLLASVAGAAVGRAPSPEIGWTEVEMDPRAVGDPVLGVLGANPWVIQYHYDTFGEPERGAILGRTGAGNQALRVGDRAWGVQFHIEVGPGAIYSWLGSYGDQMQREGIDLDAFRAETAERWRAYRRMTIDLAAGFSREVVAFARGR